MSPLERRAIGFILLGGITIIGIIWQYKLITKDIKQFKGAISDKKITKVPYRIKWGFILCIFLIAGIIVNALIANYIDVRRPYSFSQMWKDVFKTAWFSLIFLGKTFLGPIITMGTLAIASYYFLQYGIINKLPIVSEIMDFVASLAPDWLEKAYTFVYMGYAVITSIKDTTNA